MFENRGVQGSSEPDRELLDAAALCGHLIPPSSVYGFLAAQRGRLFPDELFADLFPSGRGRPSVPADVVASVLVLQQLEGLSDRQSVEALRTDIRWKAACGLALDDEGFHATVLTYWRNRLQRSDRPHRIDEAVRQVAEQTGVLSGRSRRALDSTVLFDAVATQDTVTQLVAQIRRVRRLVPAAREVIVTGHDYDRAGKPVCAWDEVDARDALVSALVTDALAILDALPVAGLDDEQEQAVALLALVAGQDVEPGDTPGSWRIARAVAKDRVVSTVDPESRHVHKTVREHRDGFKAHLAVEPETGLITGHDLTAGNAADGPISAALLASELEPVQVFGDSAYGAGPTRAALVAAGHELVIKPLPLRPAVPGGLTRDDFAVDHTARTVTCPAGITRPFSTKGTATFGARCRHCALRARCTTAKAGRSIHVTAHDDQLVAARAAAGTETFQSQYRRWRPMAERAIAWIVADNHRRVRYRGIMRNRLWLSLRVAVVNLRRLLTLGLQPTTTGWAVA
jgi:IS5 family transposase